jgi:hypothetical protein
MCTGDAETDDAAFNTASTLVEAVKATINQLNEAVITGVTTTGCAAGEMMHVKLRRNSGDASDTHGGTASVLGVEVTLRRAQ